MTRGVLRDLVAVERGIKDLKRKIAKQGAIVPNESGKWRSDDGLHMGTISRTGGA